MVRLGPNDVFDRHARGMNARTGMLHRTYVVCLISKLLC